MKESELAEKFIDYFNDGYEVYPEVPAAGGIVDFVATDGTIYIGCEVKRSFGLKVMEQAFRRKHYFHYTYVCVPQSKANWSFREMILRNNGIGLLVATEVYKGYDFIETIKPKLYRNAYTPDLKEYMKKSVSGSQNERVTAFKHTVTQIKKYLGRYGEAHIDDVLERVDYHYNTLSTAKSSLRKWIKQGVIEGIEWDRAVLSLKEEATTNENSKQGVL